MRRTVIAGAVAGVLAATCSSAAAVTSGHWAGIEDWDTTARTGTIAQPDVVGFPDAAVTSNSRSAAATGPISGASTWLAASTEPGAVYGTSRNQPYLNLRPAADNPGSPSTTTYTFDTPTPTSGWSFTLGDLDAEFVDVQAIGTDGQPVAIGDLGFQSTFNYCLGAGTPTCDARKSQPVPTFDPGTGRVAGPGVADIGPGWSDTDGAAAWFSPTVGLRSLTITSTWRAGLPTYQTWFAALSRDITGTVSGPDECSISGLDVTLRDPDGDEVATTTTEADGTWSFDGVATRDDWTVDVSAPEGCEVDGDTSPPADLSIDDAVVDTTLRVADDPTPTPEPTQPQPSTGPAQGSSPAAAAPARATVVLPDTGGPDLRILESGVVLVLLGAATVVIGVPRRRA